MNSVTISGNLGNDPESKTTQSGKNFCYFSVADKTRKDVVIWWNCTAWGKTAELIETWFHKGDKIVLFGQIELKQWQVEGVDNESLDIVVNSFDFGSKKPEDG